MNTSYSRSSTFRESLFEGYNPDGSLKTSETSSFREDCLSPFRFNCFMTLSGKFGPTSARNRNGKFSWSARYVFRDVENTTNSTSAMSSLNKNREHQLVCSVNLPKINDNPLGLGLKLDAGYFNRSISERTEYMSASNIESLSYLQQVAFLSAATGGYALKGMFMYRAGVTLEYLDNKGQFGQNATSSPLDYGEFNAIPNVILRMGYKRNHFNLQYRMNVKRPSISMLNPYVTVYDNYNTSGGNPSLKGEKRHNLSFSYSYSFNVTWMRGLNAGIHYSHTSNAISRFTELSSEGVAHTTYANIGSCDAVGAHVNATFVPVKSLTLILGMRYSHSRYALPDSKVNSYGTPNLDLSAKWSPKWFELRGDFRLSPFNAGAQTTKYQLYPMLNLSISRYFEKIHLGVSASVNDVVHFGTSTRNTIQGSNFIRHSVNQTDGIIANFRIYWRFGKYQAMPMAASIAYD